jgi:hypothetical protein
MRRTRAFVLTRVPAHAALSASPGISRVVFNTAGVFAASAPAARAPVLPPIRGQGR